MKGSGRTGRRPGTTRSREKILSSARAEFSARGYGGATIARIARRAGCDSALVHHFFGTKERLFDAAMELPEPISERWPSIVNDPEHLGENLARLLLESRDEEKRGRQVMLGLLRSALSSESAARRVREVILHQTTVATLKAMSVPDAELRGSLIGAHLVGIMVARHVTQVEPLASMSVDDLVGAVAPTLQDILFGDVGHGAVPVRVDGPDT